MIEMVAVHSNNQTITIIFPTSTCLTYNLAWLERAGLAAELADSIAIRLIRKEMQLEHSDTPTLEDCDTQSEIQDNGWNGAAYRQLKQYFSTPLKKCFNSNLAIQFAAINFHEHRCLKHVCKMMFKIVEKFVCPSM